MVSRHNCMIALLVSMMGWPPVHTFGAEPTSPVVVVVAAVTERETALYVARDHGFFRRSGVEVDLVQTRNSPLALATMVSGHAKMLWGSASTANLSAMAEGLDLVFVAGFINKLSGTIMSHPSIEKPNDLRGKAFGLNTLSGAGWGFTMVALEHWGLVPARDKIQFRILGQQDVIAQGLINGSVDAAYLSYAHGKFVKDRGMRQLVDLQSLPVSFQGAAVLALRNFVRDAPGPTESIVRALSESVEFIRQPTNRGAVIRTMMKNLRITDANEAQEGYQRIVNLYDKKPYPTVDGLANVIRVTGRTHEKVRRLKAEELIMDGIVRKLESAGRF